MLATRIIPVILCRGRQLIKGERFDSWRSVGVAAQAARVHAMRGVDELMLLDIAATAEGRGPDLALIEALAANCFVPLTVGGGIRSMADVRNLMAAGADRVCINTAAYEIPWLLSSISMSYGAQAVAVSIDVRNGFVSTRCGAHDTVTLPEEWAAECVSRGAGEIILNCCDRDGTMQGYDLALIRRVAECVNVPLVAAGGCRDYFDMLCAIKEGASAVAAGALFQFDDSTPDGAAQYLRSHGIETRVRECA